MNPTVAELAQRFWDLRCETSPTSANLYGDHRFNAELEDVSAAAEAETAERYRNIIAEAEAIDTSDLDAQDRITVELLIHEARGGLVSLDGEAVEFLVDPMLGPHVLLPAYAPQTSITEPDHAHDIASRWEKVGELFDQLADRHRDGVAKGRTPPATLVRKSLEQLDRYLASPIESDPFTRPRAPEAFSEHEEAEWRQRLTDTVTNVIRPAVERYRNVVRDEVAPAARHDDNPGLTHIPGGDELYRTAVANYTSLDDLGPEEIHQMGLDLIEELEQEYRELGPSALGTDDLSAIYARLRDDPDLRYSEPEEVLAEAKRSVEAAEAAAPEWFGILPKQRCVVVPIAELEAQEAPLAYYMPPASDGSRPGAFFINSSLPQNMTRYEADALAFHEGVPGHHFQISIAQEIDGLPEFRKHALLHAYVEGWGLYTERLADEMGLYPSDLSRLGMLSFDSWRAGRLVVDTGIHAMGWSRQQAIDFLADHSPQQRTNIENEVDRYIGYFGQALSYMIGRLEIERVRASAAEALADRFDVRAFHDVVLGSGPVTLTVLRRLVGDWVEQAE